MVILSPPTVRSVSLLFALAVVSLSCKMGSQVENVDARITDFSGSTSTVGNINLTTIYEGSDIGKSAILTVCAQQGAEVPACGCSSPIHRIDDVPAGRHELVFDWDTNLTSNTIFSFSVCIMDNLGELKSQKSIRGVSPGTPEGLTQFSCKTSVAGNHGTVDCTLAFPDEVSGYGQIEIRKIDGAAAPNIDCTSDGVSVESITDFTGQVHTIQITNENPIPEVQSLLACVRSSDGSVLSTSSSVGILARDSQGPGNLQALTGRTPVEKTCSGKVALDVDYPDDISDLKRIVIRKSDGTSAPADCASGTSEQIITSFVDGAIELSNQGTGAKSYRLCLYDAFDNLTSTAKEIATNVTPCAAAVVSGKALGGVGAVSPSK